jgi:hypothetical protein
MKKLKERYMTEMENGWSQMPILSEKKDNLSPNAP